MVWRVSEESKGETSTEEIEMNKEQLTKYHTRLGIESPSPAEDVERNARVENAVTQGGKGVIQSPSETTETNATKTEETKGGGYKGKFANTKEATKPMDDAKIRAVLKEEVLKKLNLEQQLSSLSEQVTVEHQAQIAEVKAEITELRQELSQSRQTIKELRAEMDARTHTTSDLRKAIKAEEEAETERQKAETEKPEELKPWNVLKALRIS